jgi:hypothetical protein
MRCHCCAVKGERGREGERERERERERESVAGFRAGRHLPEAGDALWGSRRSPFPSVSGALPLPPEALSLSLLLRLPPSLLYASDLTVVLLERSVPTL